MVRNFFRTFDVLFLADEPITLYSSDYGVAQFIEESEYLRKHASHIQVKLIFTTKNLNFSKLNKKSKILKKFKKKIKILNFCRKN